MLTLASGTSRDQLCFEEPITVRPRPLSSANHVLDEERRSPSFLWPAAPLGSGRMQEQNRDTRGSSRIFSLYAAMCREGGRGVEGCVRAELQRSAHGSSRHDERSFTCQSHGAAVSCRRHRGEVESVPAETQRGQPEPREGKLPAASGSRNQ